MVLTKSRRFIATSTETPARRRPARCARARKSRCPPAARAADCPAARRRRPRATRGSSPLHRRQPRDRARQLAAIEQRVRIGPLLQGVAESFRRRRRPERLSQLTQHDRCVGARVAGAEGAQHGDEPVLRRAELARVLAPGLGFVDERTRDGLEIAVARREHARDAFDRRGRRLVADEVRHQLGGDELRGGRMPAQRANRRARPPPRRPRCSALAAPSCCRVRAAAPGRRTRSGRPARAAAAPPVRADLAAAVDCACSRRVAGPADAVDGPSGQDLRQLLHVLLGVAAVDAERVQLEQLARVVLVQAAPLAVAVAALTRARAAGGGADRLEVIEVGEHRRMLRRRQHHVLEAAQHVRPNHVALVAAGERRDENLRSRRDAQMVGPERDEPLDERPIAGHARGQRGMDFRGGRSRPRARRASRRCCSSPWPAIRTPRRASPIAAGATPVWRGERRRRRHRAGRAASSVRSRSAGARRDERRDRIDSAREVSRPFVTPSDCLSLRRWPGRPSWPAMDLSHLRSRRV